jgi:hypothetical protein
MATVVGVFKVDSVSLRLHLTFIKVSSKSDIPKPRTISTALLITNCFAILIEAREYMNTSAIDPILTIYFHSHDKTSWIGSPML